MRILLAVHHFPPRYTGGAEWRTYRTARALIARGHAVRVICVEQIDSQDADPLAWSDEEFQGVPVRRLRFNLAAAPDWFVWSYDNRWIGNHLRELFAEFRPDVLHVISGYLISGRAILEAAAHGVPAVVTLTDFWFLCPRVSLRRTNGSVSTIPTQPAACAQCLGEERRRFRIPGRLFPGIMRWYWRRQSGAIGRVEARNAFLRQALNSASAVISPSQFLRTVHIQSGITPEKIVYSRQGRDFPGLTADHWRKGPSTTLRVGYLGQLAELKGVHLLIEAARRLPGAALSMTIYGDVPHFPDYATRLTNLMAGDPRIRLAGVFQGQEALAQVFPELDVVVVPSLWYENSPNTILEAFAYHTPVIASRLGGMAELVHHDRNGLLFETGDAADLARQIQRLLDNPALLTQLQAGIGPVRSTAEEIDELVAIYQQVAQSAPGRPEPAKGG